MAGARYVPNRREFARFMRSAEVGAATHAAGVRGKEYAESISPVEIGEYKGAFTVDTRVVGDRQMTVLANHAAHAVVVEVYLRGGQRVLGRAVDRIETSP